MDITLDRPFEILLAVGLAVAGGVLLLFVTVWGRATVRRVPGVGVPRFSPQSHGSEVSVLEFAAPIVLPALVWWVAREATGATVVPALAGILSFVFARRLVRWLVGLPGTLRVGRIDRGLDDMLEMMALCAGSGLGIEATLARVEIGLAGLHSELAGEVARLRHHVGLLPDRCRGYREVAATTPSQGLREIILFLERAERTGTELGMMLKLLIEEIALRNERRAEAVAQKMPVYLVVVLVLLFMPAVMLILVGPSYVRLINVLHGIARNPWGM